MRRGLDIRETIALSELCCNVRPDPVFFVQQVRPELGRVGAITLNMLRDVLPARKDSKKEGLWDIARCGDQVDILETEILNYLAKIRSGSLTDQESIEFQGLMTAIDNFENLADVIETEVVSLAHQVVRLESFSGDKTRRMLAEFHATVTQSVELAMVAVAVSHGFDHDFRLGR